MTENKPPEHLSRSAKKLWREIDGEYFLGPESLPLLETALSNWDRVREAREIIEKQGLTLGEGERIRRHPACDLEKQYYSVFLRAWRQLGLDVEPPKPTGRPPGR